MLRSIQWRITLPFVLVILLIMAVLGSYLTSSSRSSQLDNLRSHLEHEARITAQASLPSFLSEDKYAALDALARTLGEQIDTRVTIIAVDGTVLGDSVEDAASMENHADRPEFRDALQYGLGEYTRYSTTLSQKMMYVAVPISHGGEVMGIARVALPLTAVEDLVHNVTVSIALAMGIGVLVIILAAWAISRVTTRPIRKLTVAAREIASGKLEQRIGVDARDEVGELAQAFNEMSLQLKERIETISGDRARLAAILGNMADGVIMTDVEGNVWLVNDAARKLFNIEYESGKTLIEVVRDHEMDEVLRLCLKTAKTQSVQYESGTTRRYVLAIAIPIVREEVSSALLLIQDLTEL